MPNAPYFLQVRTAPDQQSGNAATEFLLAAIPVLLVGLGSIELSQWFFTKQAISLALLEAGRAGITTHGSPAAIEKAFEQALQPLFPPTLHQRSDERLLAAMTRRSAQSDSPPWQIQVLNPSPDVFNDFAQSHLKIEAAPHLQLIDNAYQAEQDARYRQSGWTEGAGPRSGLTIYQANTLILKLTYLHQPILPGMGGLLKMLSFNKGSYPSRGLAAGYLPLQQEIQLAMQSHPANWPSLGSRKVVIGNSPDSAIGQPEPEPCQGLWCMPRPAGTGPAYGPETNAAGPPLTSAANPSMPLPEWKPGAGLDNRSGQNATGGEPAADPAHTGLIPQPDDPACGVSLCCLV